MSEPTQEPAVEAAPRIKPTVGRVVHFFTSDPTKNFNNGGNGPYAAIVTQFFPTGEFANLKVFPPFALPYDVGSVHEGDLNPDVPNDSNYWTWPPKV